jgi:hypothetical protein
VVTWTCRQIAWLNYVEQACTFSAQEILWDLSGDDTYEGLVFEASPIMIGGMEISDDSARAYVHQAQLGAINVRALRLCLANDGTFSFRDRLEILRTIVRAPWFRRRRKVTVMADD